MTKNFKTGTLLQLNKKCYFLEEKWFFDISYISQTIRPYDNIPVNSGNYCVILENLYDYFYKVLILEENKEIKKLVISVSTLNNCAFEIN